MAFVVLPAMVCVSPAWVLVAEEINQISEAQIPSSLQPVETLGYLLLISLISA